MVFYFLHMGAITQYLQNSHSTMKAIEATNVLSLCPSFRQKGSWQDSKGP